MFHSAGLAAIGIISDMVLKYWREARNDMGSTFGKRLMDGLFGVEGKAEIVNGELIACATCD